jgi:hypothetical protein
MTYSVQIRTINGMIFNTTRQYIAHAVDVQIFEQSGRANEEFVTQFKEASLSTRLMTNERKNT